jgi:hypothetical protein
VLGSHLRRSLATCVVRFEKRKTHALTRRPLPTCNHPADIAPYYSHHINIDIHACSVHPRHNTPYTQPSCTGQHALAQRKDPASLPLTRSAPCPSEAAIGIAFPPTLPVLKGTSIRLLLLSFWSTRAVGSIIVMQEVG